MAGTMLSSDADVKGQPTTTPAGLVVEDGLIASSPAAWASLSPAFWADLAPAAARHRKMKCLGGTRFTWAATALWAHMFS